MQRHKKKGGRFLEVYHRSARLLAMPVYPVLTLKPSADVHLRNRHHAIFRTAVDRLPACVDGDIVEVRSFKSEFLCYAMRNAKAYICGRAIAFEEGDPMQTLRELITQAVRLRREFFSREDTTAYRLINAEGDGIPGLIVDRYDSVLAVQFTTLGMDRLRDWVVEILRELCKPSGIFEKSTGSGRKKEGLEEKEGC